MDEEQSDLDSAMKRDAHYAEFAERIAQARQQRRLTAAVATMLFFAITVVLVLGLVWLTQHTVLR